MSTELILHQPSSVNTALLPLLSGNPVVFVVHDKKMLRKKRIGDPVLFITPSEVYGLGSDSLVIALQGHGCQVEAKGKVKAERLYMLGLSMYSAKLLTKHLNQLWRK